MFKACALLCLGKKGWSYVLMYKPQRIAHIQLYCVFAFQGHYRLQCGVWYVRDGLTGKADRSLRTRNSEVYVHSVTKCH